MARRIDCSEPILTRKRHRRIARRRPTATAHGEASTGPKRMEHVLLALCAFTAALLIVAYRAFPRTKLSARKTLIQPGVRGYVVDTSGCRIPDFYPFDWSVSRYYAPARRYNCTAKPSFLRQHGRVLLLDSDALRESYNASPRHLRCWYRHVKRNESRDDADFVVVYSRKYRLHFGKPLNGEQIMVECRVSDNQTHQEFFLVPILKPEVERRCKSRIARRKNNSVDRINIVFLGLDSVSRLNSLRHLPLTREYLAKNFHVVELFGFNKVGENSFPNQIAMLAGQSGEEGYKVCRSRVYDGEDIVWKTYADLGYRTMFLEESPEIGLFTFLCKGFRGTPTDYYPRPLQLVTDYSNSTDNDSYCVRNRMKTEMYLEYTTSLLTLLGGRPYFTYTWISDISHDFLNRAGYADLPFLRTFQELSRTGVMNRSLLVFLSDHGLRYGDIRLSLVGKYEDRLPFCILLFPPTFRQKYPEVMESLRVNQYRLTTPYDIHATLVELSQFPSTVAKSEFRTKRGLSLLHEVPEGRTCNEASIHPHYCCCHDTLQLDGSNAQHWKLAQFAVWTVNSWLVKEARRLCWRHSLKDILDIRNIMTNATGDVSYFWVTVVTAPGDAIFEGTVALNKTGGLYAEKISRINAYGPQSYCVTSMKPFCICK